MVLLLCVRGRTRLKSLRADGSRFNSSHSALSARSPSATAPLSLWRCCGPLRRPASSPRRPWRSFCGSCARKSDVSTTLAWGRASPCCVRCALAGSCTVRCSCARWGPRADYLYFVVVRGALELFDCDQDAVGHRFLSMAPNIGCLSPEHMAIVPYGVGSLLFCAPRALACARLTRFAQTVWASRRTSASRCGYIERRCAAT